MENTIKTAEEYLEWASHSLSNEDGDNPTQAEILYYYAKSLLRPATVSEEEIKERLLELESFCKDNGYRPAYIEQAVLSFSEGIEWALGRQTRIVLPDEFHSNPVSPYRDGWNACIESIRTLNPSATFVTEQK